MAVLSTAFMACSNEAEPVSVLQPIGNDMQNVSFDFRYTGEGRKMTKANIPTEDALNLIQKLSVTQTDLRNEQVSISALNGTQNALVQLGQSYLLPYGLYATSYNYERSGGYLDDNIHAMLSPSFVIEDTIKVIKGVSNYVLNAKYDCFAVIWNKTELSVAIDGIGMYNNLASNLSSTYDCLFIKPKKDDWVVTFDIANAKGAVHFEITSEDVENGMFYELKAQERAELCGFSLYYEDFKRGSWW